MTERAPRPVQTPQEIAADETAASALPPALARLAPDRAIAPRTGMLAMRDGKTVIVEVPAIDPAQAKVHEARRFYADKDAERALEAEATLNDMSITDGSVIAEAGQTVQTLTGQRLPRPEEQLRRTVGQ